MIAPADVRQDAAFAEHAEWLDEHAAAEPSPRRPARVSPLPPGPSPTEVLEAERDALAEIARALLVEVATLALERLTDEEIRERLEHVWPVLVSEPVVDELRRALNDRRVRARELGIDPRSFVAPASSRRAAA